MSLLLGRNEIVVERVIRILLWRGSKNRKISKI